MPSARFQRPLSVRVCDWMLIALAVWTLCAHALVLLGGSLRALVLLFGTLAAASVVFLPKLERLVAVDEAADAHADTTQAALPSARAARLIAERIARLMGFGAGAAAVLIGGNFALRGNVMPLWWATLLVLLAAFVWSALRPAETGPLPHRSRHAEFLLWGLAALCVPCALYLGHINYDDAFYLNIAVAAADNPGRALYSGDTMLGIPGLPLHNPIHRVLSFELINAAFMWLSGVSSFASFHWGWAALGAGLAPLAQARLARLLAPQSWPLVVFLVIAAWLCTTGGDRWYGEFAFGRTWQGKSILLIFVLPLIAAYSIQFARRPTLVRFALLFSAQVVAVGASSSALWSAPGTALMSAAAALPVSRESAAASLQRLGLVLLACLYPIAIAIGLRETMHAAGIVEVLLDGRNYGDGIPLLSAIDWTFGQSGMMWACLSVLSCGWALLTNSLARRFAIATTLGVWLVLLSPYWAGFVAEQITGPDSWRALWAIPVPLLLALALASPLEANAPGARARLGAYVSCAAAVAFFALVPHGFALSRLPAEAWRTPRFHVEHDVYALAKALHASVPPGSLVLAPKRISALIPTLREQRYPVQDRQFYLHARRPWLGDEAKLRQRMTLAVSTAGKTSIGLYQALNQGLTKLDVRAVLVAESQRSAAIASILGEHGFQHSQTLGTHQLWLRPVERD